MECQSLYTAAPEACSMFRTESGVQKVVDMRVVDPARIAVGGHSYGAFMTANLLAHAGVSAGIQRLADGAAI